jgi:two-component system, OmpR family, phosphate regulon sensor histidine kinase PhoR
MDRRNVLTIALMVFSISLLIILQLLWIRNSYEKAFADFRRESDLLFKSTLIGLRNEQWMANMVELSDSVPVRMKVVFADSLAAAPDSLQSRRKAVTEVVERGEVFLGNYANGKQVAIRTQISKLHGDSVGAPQKPRSFIIRIDPDTVNLDTLSRRYAAALKVAGISLPFHIRHIKPEPGFREPVLNPMADFVIDNDREFLLASEKERRERKLNLYADTVHSDGVRVSPLHHYGVLLYNVRSHLVKQITPQLLFSGFLTAMVVAAFLFMYRSLRSQERLVKLKNDFINNVTHELKTPVATVSVALEAIQDFNPQQNRKLTEEYVQIAKRELLRLNDIADKILKASAVDRDRPETGNEHISLDEITEAVTNDRKLIIERAGASVKTTKEGNDFTIYCDASNAYQMIENLLDNALKYSSTNPIVEISIRDVSEHVTLSIKDNGIGIPKEYQKKIFEEFFRVPTGDVHNIKGYGLGLSYVQKLVHQLNGTIEVISEVGQGTTFILRFPKVRSKRQQRHG